MADSFGKKDREKRKRQKKKEKEERKKMRQADGGVTEDIMYLDEFGNFTSTPPDPSKKIEINAEDIEIGIPAKGEMDPGDFTREGVVKFFNRDKGYGFILDKNTGDSYFVHGNDLVDEIRDNDKVVFEMGSGPKGPVALNVMLIRN